MRYVIWMVVLTVIAVLLFAAKRNFPEIRDYRQSKLLYLGSFLKPAGGLILALMALSTFFASVHQVPAGAQGSQNGLRIDPRRCRRSAELPRVAHRNSPGGLSWVPRWAARS